MKKLRARLSLLPLWGLCLLLMLPSLAAAAGQPIVLGCPLSTAFLYGWDAERAIKLAVEEINAAGGVKVGNEMRPFSTEVIDTRDLEPGVPVSEALLGVEKLLLEKKADFIVGGPVRSEAALAAMPLVAKHKKISILTSGSLTPKYGETVAEGGDKFKSLFRISGEAKWMVAGEIIPCLLDIGKKYNLDRLAIMVQDVAHARAGGGIIAKVMADKGWKVATPEIYPTGATDFSLGLAKAKNEKAQVLLIWMDMPETSILLKQWHDMKVPALPFGSIIAAAEQPSFWNATEGKGEFCLANVVNAGNAPSNATPWTMKFVDAYKKKYGLEPEGYGTSSSYMAVYTIKDAIERAGSLDYDKLVAAMKATDLMGVYGRVRFDQKSNQVIPSLDPAEGAVGTIFQWQAGKRVVVFPPKIATGEIKLPPWMQAGQKPTTHTTPNPKAGAAASGRARRERDLGMEILIYGVVNSVSLALMALGFTLVYGVSRLPNFAHGSLYVTTGFITWLLLNRLGIPYVPSMILALVFIALVGAATYHFILVRIRGMSISEIIASYAIGLAILEGLRWGGLKGATLTLPVFAQGSVDIIGVTVDAHRLAVIGLGALLVGALWLFVNRTRLGLALKGMAQDERAALTLGIDSDRMAVFSMALGAVMAGLAALVLLPLGNIVVESGYHVLIMAVAVCIVGGLGSWTGAVLAAFLIGFAQILTTAWLGPHFQVVVALLAIIVTLISRPSGLFGRQKELEERV